VKIYPVDAFTGRPSAGNPAGVCVLPAGAPILWQTGQVACLHLRGKAATVLVAELVTD
jgi:hypothetical protein